MPSLTGEGLVIWILGLLLPLLVEGFKKLKVDFSKRTVFIIAFVSSFVLAILAILVTNGFKFTSLGDAVSSISLVFALSQVAYKLVYSSFMGLAAQPKAAPA